MAIMTTDSQNYSDIANAIREKNGSDETYYPEEMAPAILNLDTEGIKLASIAITAPPVKTSYVAGETFDAAGMVVTATYTNGATATATGYTFSPSTGLTDGTTAVTILYTEGGITATASQPITVIHRLESIAVTTPPDKTLYEYGDAFEKSGMIVKATYSDGAVAIVTGTTYSPTTFSSVGNQIVTISYTENGVTKTTTTTVTVERKTLTAVPSQSGTLTYTGSAQSPVWSNYSAAQLTMSGETSATDAGIHYTIFTPTENYRWSDGTTAGKSMPWSIGKAVGSMTLSKTSVTLNADAASDTITVTRSGDGAISAVSDNTSVAAVSVSGNVVTISSVGDTTGTATVTISVGESQNYLAAAGQAVSVSAEFMPAIGTALNDCTWDEINQISAAGLGSSFWSVGDCKAVLVNGTVGTLAINQTLYVYIIGFDHNSAIEGNGINFGTFKTALSEGIDICLCDSEYNKQPYDGTKYFNLNHTGYSNGCPSYGGWKSCELRYDILGSTNIAPKGYGSIPTYGRVGYDADSTTATKPVANTLMSALPTELRAVMKPITKYTDNVVFSSDGAASGSASYVTDSVDYLPLLAEFEVFGERHYANTSEQRYQQQYQYYKNGNSRKKNKHNNIETSSANWLTRSCGISYNTGVVCVTETGSYDYKGHRYSYGIAPVFKV